MNFQNKYNTAKTGIHTWKAFYDLLPKEKDKFEKCLDATLRTYQLHLKTKAKPNDKKR